MSLQIRLESLPKMNLRVQSDTTSILVRQLTCLLNIGKSRRKSDTKLCTTKLLYIYIYISWQHGENQRLKKMMMMMMMITLHI